MPTETIEEDKRVPAKKKRSKKKAPDKKKLDITEIDSVDEPEPEEEIEEDSGVPPHLVMQPCGLPKILVEDRRELTGYEVDHGMSVTDRNTLTGQITKTERDLFQVYTGAARRNRVTIEHFVTALRLWNDGCVLHPKRSRVLNDMKVF